MNYEWMDSAICAQADPEVWFPEGGGNYRAARAICGSCPVQRECAEHAARLEGGAAHPGRHGAWAGAAPRARAQHSVNRRTQERDETIQRLHRRGGMDADEIATQAGCDTRTVYRVLARHRRNYEEAA
ncbi:WhiB family transcriptional regulator [Streptomyces sp. NPDC052000]|uniref:WhiB family transcriptional regulator n=1 Tax=Streptomyces sp. NPDC052000 TaxID=3155676 RepID=UPI00344D45BD